MPDNLGPSDRKRPATGDDRRTGSELRSFGRRRARRLRAHQATLVTDLLPRLRPDLAQSPKSGLTRLFPTDIREIWLEIGFGGGEHLAAQAAAHPECGLIGCEPYITGVARLLALAGERGLTNLRVVVDDARLLLEALPDGCLERIFVLFPDPWPKTRHHKRRIVNPATAAQFARLLAPGGELRLATDDMDYARAMLLAVLPERRLTWLAREPAGWRQPPPDWVKTRYQEKALAAGRRCVFLRFERTVG
jgi:tRNA (guanine-N7-)-methyltransferase